MRAIDRFALEAAYRLTARQPRCSETIDQLPPGGPLLPNDLVPMFRNGKTMSVLGSGIAVEQIISGPSFVYNVRLSPYNAQGNGTTDDTASIQLALDTCGAAGGGIVYFPFGTYLIGATLLVGDNTTVMGQGGTNSVIVASDAFVGAHAAFNATNGSSCLIANSQLATASLTTVQSNIVITQLGFNGNGANLPRFLKNPGGCVFLRQVYNPEVSNCELINCAASGIVITGIDINTDWPGNPIDFNIYNNHINMLYNPNGPPPLNGMKGLSGFPIVCRGASIGIIYDNIIGDLFDTLNIHTNDGCDTPGCSDVTIYGNYISNCGDGIGCDSCNDITVVGNTINKAGGYGISTFSTGGPDDDPIGCNNFTVVGNNITNHGMNAGTNPGKSGIRYSTPAAKFPSSIASVNATITGNTIQFDPNATGPFGIHIEGDYSTVASNIIDLGLAQKQSGDGLTGIEIDSSPGGGNYCAVTGNTIWDGFANANGILINIGNMNDITGAVITGNNVDPTTITTPWMPASSSSFLNCFVRGNSFNPFGFVNAINNDTIPYTNGFPASGATFINGYGYDIQIVVNYTSIVQDNTNYTTFSNIKVGPSAGTLQILYSQDGSGAFVFTLPAGQYAQYNYTPTGTGGPAPGQKWFAL